MHPVQARSATAERCGGGRHWCRRERHASIRRCILERRIVQRRRILERRIVQRKRIDGATGSVRPAALDALALGRAVAKERLSRIKVRPADDRDRVRAAWSAFCCCAACGEPGAAAAQTNG